MWQSHAGLVNLMAADGVASCGKMDGNAGVWGWEVLDTVFLAVAAAILPSQLQALSRATRSWTRGATHPKYPRRKPPSHANPPTLTIPPPDQHHRLVE